MAIDYIMQRGRETNSPNDLDIVCDPPSRWYLLSRVSPPSLSFPHVNTRKERSQEAVTTRKLSCRSKKEERSVQDTMMHISGCKIYNISLDST